MGTFVGWYFKRTLPVTGLYSMSLIIDESAGPYRIDNARSVMALSLKTDARSRIRPGKKPVIIVCPSTVVA